MYGFKKGAKPEQDAKLPKGGKIQGPGTGTSDSIKTEIPKGSYIMPADSTQQIGPKALGELGQPVPVNVSSGEYQMPPEQVHAVGVQALNQMRDATHTPAGFKPQNDGLYFVDGGSPAEEERKRLAGAGPSPQIGAVSLGNERRAERMSGEGMYGKANADVGGALNYLNRGDPVKDAASAVGGFFARSSDQARLADYGSTGTPSPIAATPAAVPTPPAAVGATELPSTKGRTDYGFTPDPGQGPVPGMSVRPTSAEGINRIDNAPGLKSPLFTNLPTGEAISGMQGGTVNTMPASAFTSAGPQASRAVSAALQAAAARGDWDAVRGFYQRNGGTWQGRTSEQNEGAYQPRSSKYGLRFARRSQDRAADRAQAERRLSREEALARDRLDIDRRRAEGEAQARGFEVRGMQRLERLYQQLEAAETPEARAAIAEQIRAMSGKDTPNRYTVVPGGQEVTEQGMLRTVPSRVLNNQTGQLVDLSGQGTQALPPIAENPAVQKIMQNTALSREERAAQIRALGYK